MHNDHEWLKQFTHDPKLIRQLDECVAFGGNVWQAAKNLGIDNSFLNKKIRHLREMASVKTIHHQLADPETSDAGFSVKGTSKLYDAEGKVKVQWVKTDRDKELQAQALKDFVEGLCADLKVATPVPVTPHKHHTPDLLSAVFVGDAHIGMYSWGLETKHSDFDSDIATKQLREAIDYLVDKAEPSETGLLVNLGDFIHTNGSNNMTAGGTPQDVDTRLSRVMHMAAVTLRYMTDRMLSKFAKVVLVCAKGNHDTDTSIAIQMAMKFYYDKEGRVTVLETNGFYHYIEYGQWLLGIHHGDKQKPEALAGSMARDMSEAWGRTSHRLWCVGHFHKEQVKTLAGVKYKVFAALPPPDSWHSSKGYNGDGEMEMITFRKSGGIYSSHTFCIEQPKHQPDITI